MLDIRRESSTSVYKTHSKPRIQATSINHETRAHRVPRPFAVHRPVTGSHTNATPKTPTHGSFQSNSDSSSSNGAASRFPLRGNEKDRQRLLRRKLGHPQETIRTHAEVTNYHPLRSKNLLPRSQQKLRHQRSAPTTSNNKQAPRQNPASQQHISSSVNIPPARG